MSLGTRDLQDYDRFYCHIVAGLVGRGLTQLFVGLGFERDSALLSQNWNEMGLMLQRTNITRDFCEDLADHRLWWPKSVTSKYASEPARVEVRRELFERNGGPRFGARAQLVGLPGRRENEQVFAFCSVPQIMAVATLQACYGNKLVYTWRSQDPHWHRAEGLGDDKTAKICSKILSKCVQAGAVKSLKTPGWHIALAYASFYFAAVSFRRIVQA
ncbi:hypothetical protein BASA81_008332 [Batrachochytrium salamandrivorans]|nr:hypothetical protein BASA81_008332 [Batrachochytrium salamandrivorans]